VGAHEEVKIPMDVDVDEIVEDDLDAEVDEIHNHTTSDKTKKVYRSKQVQFILFLHKRHREALSPEFLQAADAFDESGLHAFIKKIVEERKSPSPILFASLQARHVSRFVVSLKRSDSSRATPAVHSAARSAVSDYFRSYDFVPPKKMAQNLATLFRGLRRKTAMETSKGNGKAYIGKKPLEFSLYAFLCKELLKAGSTEALFLHTMMVISWNLMCSFVCLRPESKKYGVDW